MKIIAKSLQHANIVLVAKEGGLNTIDPQQVMALFKPHDLRGSTFVDDPAMKVKVFGFPEKKLKIIMEEKRLRIEDLSGESPDSSKFGLEAYRLILELAKGLPLDSWGFNFDIFYRGDQVIPQREIMKNFVTDVEQDQIQDFGWQFTLVKPSEKKQESYFFKVISPLEIAIHANYHFSSPPVKSAEELQKYYEEYYSSTEKILQRLSF
jgi:hypothetical protein